MFTNCPATCAQTVLERVARVTYWHKSSEVGTLQRKLGSPLQAQGFGLHTDSLAMAAGRRWETQGRLSGLDVPVFIHHPLPVSSCVKWEKEFLPVYLECI